MNLSFNFVLVIGGLSWIIAQILKVVCYYIKDKKINFKHMAEAGGMPSVHSALVTSIALSIGLVHGFNSSLFALAFVFTTIVLYDAIGVRRSAGQQAFIINKLVAETDIKDDVQNLKELLGHSPLEMAAGVVVGLATTLIGYYFFYL